jgi:hypothetical protein
MIITSLNRSKELKEAGWDTETEFIYRKNTYVYDEVTWYLSNDYLISEDDFPAPTLDELLEKLSCKTSIFERCSETLGGWIFTPQDGDWSGKSTWSSNICDAVAWTWVIMNRDRKKE